MGKKGFDRKKAVRFALTPGPQIDGKPSVIYKPVQTRKSKVSKKQRKEVISQLADYDQITINGKVVDENEIPAYVLEQIRGRSDLVYNHIKESPKEEEVGDLYDIQDAKEDNEYEEYEDYNFEEEEAIKQQMGEDHEDDDWEDQQQHSSQQHTVNLSAEIPQKKIQKFNAKVEQFPTIQQMHTVNIEGKEYKLTKQQFQILDTVIPQNYEQMDFGGLKFTKYNEDGLLLSQKQQYEKYLIGENEKVVVIDTYEHIPSKPHNTIDNDLKPSQINGNPNIRQVEDALNYDGDQQAYEELEDDFFAKMIQMEQDPKEKVSKKAQTHNKEKKEEPKISKIVKQTKQIKEPEKPLISEQEMEIQLQKALHNFQHNIEEKKQSKPLSDEQQEQTMSNRNHQSMNFTDLQKRQEYIGRDGELDWRCLTKQQKKQYMKTKVIREFYDELRERQIEQKMKGKSNITPEELHLKQLVQHIPYEQDFVMQNALADDLKKQQHPQNDEDSDYESLSDQDDIVSFHQKTSIIASNLSVIEEPDKRKKKENKDKPEEDNISIIKVIPERRNRNQTSQERKERKNKLRQLKKQKKEQKKQFAQRFNKIKRQTSKKQNPSNPLNKISYVKIY